MSEEFTYVTLQGRQQVRRRILGSELKVGDRIAPWGGRTTCVTKLVPYKGRYQNDMFKGARVAHFKPFYPTDEFRGSEMTITQLDTIELVVSETP